MKQGATTEFEPGRLLPVLDAGPDASGYLLAFSGGLDSTVLLAAMAELRERSQLPPLRAVHVDHGLQTESAEWRRHCARICAGLAVEFHGLAVDARPQAGESPEAAARHARYQAIAGILRPGEALLLAQHRDDQVETFFYRLLRGAGSRGLGVMAPWRGFANGWLGRPLLDWPRAALLGWAQARGLAWIEDPSNRDPRYARNYLRLHLLPRLRKGFPGFEAPVLRAAANLREDAELLAEIAAQDLLAVASGEQLDLRALAALSRRRQVNLLRAWLEPRLGQPPGRDKVYEILALFLATREDAQPLLVLPAGELRRYRDRLHWLAGGTTGCGVWRQAWDGVTALRLHGSGRELTPAALAGQGVVWPATARLEFRSPPPGLRVRRAGERHSRPLKKLLQDAAVSPWERRCLAVLFADDRPLWVETLGALGTAGDKFVKTET